MSSANTSMSDIWLSERQARELLGFKNSHSFLCARRGLGLLPRFQVGTRKYYARADIERILDTCAGSYRAASAEAPAVVATA